ncbi:Rossmann-like domain-containing protein [Vibrio sp. LaRot3]|uniref:Rossmann-like domain-containing protein n=1 Tax=Vibrio sp. LaRot3 TaxID=2998829 RepID=UPI0022CE1B1B|nr:DUF364 domain-containing protein [Vibrio sp. LaRot3]MDA0147538.1 DUF364 domain-containing protein [Vibrio sp. LaRot3]
MLQFHFNTVDDMINAALQGKLGEDPNQIYATGAFDIVQTTQFPTTSHRYFNRYIVFRVGTSFGACCIEQNQVDRNTIANLSGESIATLLQHDSLVVKVAALDAYLGNLTPLRSEPIAERRTLELGTPIERAIQRDRYIVEMLRCKTNETVGLIGVVNPLVEAIAEQGAICLPCDFNMEKTASGITVEKEMTALFERSDQIIATGMTLSNGSFDQLVQWSRVSGKPLTIYAQTGANIAKQFMGNGVHNLLAETFPFSQFSAEETPVYQLFSVKAGDRAS